MSHHQNILRIKIVYDALEELGPEVIFVGGATVAMYADRLGEEVRPTDDVDYFDRNIELSRICWHRRKTS